MNIDYEDGGEDQNPIMNTCILTLFILNFFRISGELNKPKYFNF
jgi:hypothetical protein